jgi:hypothetical protein
MLTIIVMVQVPAISFQPAEADPILRAVEKLMDGLQRLQEELSQQFPRLPDEGDGKELKARLTYAQRQLACERLMIMRFFEAIVRRTLSDAVVGIGFVTTVTDTCKKLLSTLTISDSTVQNKAS